MFRKFAGAQVLGTQWSKTRVKNASLSKLAEMSFNDYLTDDGYVYVRVRAISSRVNRNWDGWPAAELEQAYRTFIGKPIFVDHHNHDPKKARGVVVDAELHVEDQKTSSMDPYYSSKEVDPSHLPGTWIELLLEVDAKRYPRFARAFVSGDIDAVSMGADVEFTKCSICDNKANEPGEFCKHVISKGAYYDYRLPDGTKTSRRAYENCFGVGFFEISGVFEPADETALTIGDVRTSTAKWLGAPDLKDMIQTASMFDEEPYDDGPAEDPTLEAGLLNRADESEQVTGWRYEDLIRMGYPEGLARQIAEQEYRGEGRGIDRYDLRGLIDQGATPEQAYSIISRRTASVKTAENPIPQTDMTTMPASIDTLRQEDVCSVCGSTMEDGECELCGYTEPPEGFNNPDLEKAKEVDKQLHGPEQGPQTGDEAMDPSNQVDAENVAGSSTTTSPMVAKYRLATINPDGTLTVKVRTAASPPQAQRINTQERPLLPATRQNSDKPLAVRTLKNPTAPTESNLKENMTTNTKTADGASPWGEGTQAEKRVDVTGVGAVSGDPLSGITTENVEKDTGNFQAPHTDTWSGDEGDSLGQQDAVTSEAFEGAGGNGNSSGNATGVSSPGPTTSAVKEAEGNGTSAPGFPDSEPSHVDVTSPLAEEVGDRTKTFGTDDKHTTEPITSEDANELGGPIGEKASSFGFAVKAMKLAETEVTLGLTSDKWNRVAELETKSEEYIDAQLETLSKVRTAGLRRTPTAQRTAGLGRMPSFRPVTASAEEPVHAVSDVDTETSLSW